MSDTQRPTLEERMERAKGQYVFLGEYCGRVEQIDGGTLYIRFDDHTLPGRVQAAHEHFQPLHETGVEVQAGGIWADGADIRITAYRYDPERPLIRLKTQRIDWPARA